MINDRIRHIAQGLADLDMAFESRNLHEAMNGSNPPETLRAVFLSLKMTVGVEGAVNHYAKELLELLAEGDGTPDARAQLMMDILEDVDVLTLAERPQAWAALVDHQHVADMVKYEALTEVIDRVWSPKVSGSEAARMWSEVVHAFDDVQADRLLARTEPDAVPFREMFHGAAIKNVRAVDLLVERMSSAAVARETKGVLQKVEEEDGGADRALHDAMAILGAHHVRRSGVEDGVGARVMAVLLEQAYNGVRAGEHFAQLALATGGHKNPEFFAALRGTEVSKVTAPTLQRLLHAGVPASKKIGKVLTHLLEEPSSAEHASLLWERMDAKQRDNFLSSTVPSQLGYFHTEWQRDFGSVLEGNPLVWLHEAGVDLGSARRYGFSTRSVHLHDTNENRQEDVRLWVFLTLQAVGAYEKNMRCDGLTALHLAAQSNDVAAIKALVRLGHDVDAMSIGRPGSKEGETPLVTAARKGYESVVRVLLEAGADTGIKTRSGRSLMQVTRGDAIRRLINSVRSSNAVDRAMPVSEAELGAPERCEMGGVL